MQQNYQNSATQGSVQNEATPQSVDWQITGGKVLNVYTRSFEETTLWIQGRKIIAVGSNQPFNAAQTVDASGQYIVPGFIDAHMHIESSLLTPSQLGPLLLRHGVTSVVADPHEIANVAGRAGIEYLLNDAQQTALDIFFMLPSAVPCAPFEHTGATLNASDLSSLYQSNQIHGLAEVMDYPALAHKDPDLLQKIRDAHQHHLPVDGHLAGLHGHELLPYQQLEIRSDHESTTPAELLERVKAGFYVYLREGTVERDLSNLVSAVTPAISQRLAFCTDDKTVTDLLSEGSIDANLILAMANGLAPEIAYTMASFNAAQGEELNDRGALTPGKLADFVMLSDLKTVEIERVMKAGAWVDSKADSSSAKATTVKPYTLTHIHQHLQSTDLALPLSTDEVHVIGVDPNHIATRHLISHVLLSNGQFTWQPQTDIIKIASIERHHNTGNVGVALVSGFKLERGAFASSIGHDSHNLIVAGTNDDDMQRAIAAITASDGGLAVVYGEHIEVLPLPVAGLMSALPAEQTAQQLAVLHHAFHNIAPSITFDPFITLSFLSLPVIPSLKITDQGLYNFETGKFIPVGVLENEK